MRDKHLESINRKIDRIRFYKSLGKVVYSLAIITLITILFIRLDSVMIMQKDTLDKLNDLSLEIDEMEQTLDEVDKVAVIEDLSPTSGMFTITHYCDCTICCGKSDGITATGTKVTENQTIAVDPSVIPLGSEVLIDGQVYIAEDVGGAIKGNKVDIYVADHNTAIQRGKIQREVTVLGK